MRKLISLLMMIIMANITCSAAFAEAEILYWSDDSAALSSIVDFVVAVTDPDSESYVAPEDRIAVFDFDGTLYGELYPTYFDVCLFMHRVLHDETFNAPSDIKEYAGAL